MVDIKDIQVSIQSGILIQDKFFKNADFLKDSRGRLITFTGGYTVVVPAFVKNEKWAFRCWHTPVIDAKQRYSLISKAIKKTKLPYFCSFDYTENGLIIKGDSYPITKMRWIEGLNLKKYICKYSHDSKSIKRLAKSFLDMVFELHSHEIAHGDLQHGNIIVSDSGEIFLVDYDSMYVPEMKDQYTDIISGLIDYQHPSRKTNSISSSRIDFFSELIIYTSLLAIAVKPELVGLYNVEDSESLLFTSKDFEDLKKSQIYKDLKVLQNQDIDLCLNVLLEYLSTSDINLLQPIENYLISFKVDCPSLVPVNESFIIKWKSKGANSIQLSEFGEVPLEGEKELKVTTSKTLTFTLISRSGYRTNKSINIKAAPRATINYYKVDKEYTLDTVPVKISWSCTGAKRVIILGEGEQNLSGSLILNPKEETTYTLCVEDAFGMQKRQITIKKLPLPLIRQIMVPSPKINRSLNISYKAPSFNLYIPTPTFNSVFCKLELPKLPKLSKSGYYIRSIGWDKKSKSNNIFKSLFSKFLRKKV